MITKIISGGQTGADQGGLEAAKILGLEFGGTAPAGFRTELGRQYDLLRSFHLVEGMSGRTIADDYRNRTKQNIQDSNGTVIFGNTSSPGSKLTLGLCEVLQKPLLIILDVDRQLELVRKGDLLFQLWLEANHIHILNIAGNRESKNPGIQTKVRGFLVEALRNKEDKL